jgi:hypothetical protein
MKKKSAKIEKAQIEFYKAGFSLQTWQGEKNPVFFV